MIQGKKSLKVLFVTHKHPPSIGGMQKQSYELVKNYNEIGNSSLICFNNKYPIWLFFVIVIPWVWIRLLQDKDITTIHGNDGLMAIFLTPFLLTSKKIFITIHGLDVVSHINIYQWWIRNFLRRYDGVIAVSNETGQECIKRGVPKSKVTFIPNAVDPPAVNVKDASFRSRFEKEYGLDLLDKVLITSVGRAIPRKGFSWFAKNVLPELSDSVVYLIVGPKEKRESFYAFLSTILSDSLFKKICQMNGIGMDYFQLKKIVDDPGLAGKICLLGKLPQQHLDQLYMHSDIFVMPNLRVKGDYEGFGLVAQEAVYNGALCIASDIDGIPSAIQHEETGILLPSNDPSIWIQTIERYIYDPELLKTDAERFQAKIQSTNYSWMDMTIRYKTLFEKD